MSEPAYRIEIDYKGQPTPDVDYVDLPFAPCVDQFVILAGDRKYRIKSVTYDDRTRETRAELEFVSKVNPADETDYANAEE